MILLFKLNLRYLLTVLLTLLSQKTYDLNLSQQNMQIFIVFMNFLTVRLATQLTHTEDVTQIDELL